MDAPKGPGRVLWPNPTFAVADGCRRVYLCPSPTTDFCLCPWASPSVVLCLILPSYEQGMGWSGFASACAECSGRTETEPHLERHLALLKPQLVLLQPCQYIEIKSLPVFTYLSSFAVQFMVDTGFSEHLAIRTQPPSSAGRQMYLENHLVPFSCCLIPFCSSLSPPLRSQLALPCLSRAWARPATVEQPQLRGKRRSSERSCGRMLWGRLLSK